MTYRELVYLIFDENKIFSDDSVFENEHVITMLNKYRSLLFTQKYKKAKQPIPTSFYQRLNVNFAPLTGSSGIYKSTNPIPNNIDMSDIWTYTFTSSGGIGTYNFNFINPQRFKMTGINKWLQKEIYATIDMDSSMYIKSASYNISEQNNLITELELDNIISEDGDQYITETDDSSFMYYDTVLENPIDGYIFNGFANTDPLDMDFPCEASLIQPVIELCLKELGGFNLQKRDALNNANDDPSTPQSQPQAQ